MAIQFFQTANFANTVTATKFVKSGGTSSQFLMADGSVSTGGSGVTLTNGVDNRLVTAASSSSINGESGLLFAGSYLEITPGDIASPLHVKRTSASTRQVNIFLSADDGSATSEGFLGIDSSADLRYGASSSTSQNDKIFHDGYHPNADAWTTERTITLSGDLNGSVTLDGSADVTLSAQVVNNSHTHDDRYYTETESDARFLKLSGGTMTGDITMGGSGPGKIKSNTDLILQVDADNNTSGSEFKLLSGGGSTLFKIVENGNIDAHGVINFTGTATTTSVDRGLYWTGFDKESTTDFTDNASITHTTNTGGHSGSVLEIKSMNDASDGIAFTTHASSLLKHNGDAIFSEGHKPTWSEIESKPTTFAPSSHNHAASEITSGTLDTARLPEFIEHKYTYQKYSSNGVFMPMVKGGLLTGGASVTTGRLRIKLPHYQGAIMQSFTVDIYEYNTNRMQSILVGGYTYDDTNATWYNTSAIALMDSDNRDLTVRFGSDETNDFQCVSIGETNTTWSYPQVVVRDYMGGHSASTSEVLGSFVVEFVTTDSATYDHSHANNQPYSHWDKIEGKPSTFTPSSHTQAWSTITSTPTTISGYGITDAFSGSYADLTNVPSTFAPSAHNHAASEITSGTLATARLDSSVLFGNNSSGTNEGNFSNWNDLSKTGFYSDDNATGRWTTNNWSSVMHFKLYDDNNNWASQLGFDTYDTDFYYRRKNNGTWSSWFEVYHEGHKPTWSEIESKPSTFTPSSHTQAWSTITSTPTTLAGYGITDAAASNHNHDGTYVKIGATHSLGSVTRFQSNNEIDTASGSQSPLEIYQDNAGHDAFMTFHVSGDYAAYFGLDGASNDFVFGGWSKGAVKQRIYHEGHKPTWSEVESKPSTFTPSAHNQAWSTITSTPTTLSGYGITDAAAKDFLNSGYVDFTVNGDADTYYPVSIRGGGKYGFHMYSISRQYNWTAPNTWYTSTHRGGLTLTWQYSGDGFWGGNDHDVRVIKWDETYSTIVGGMSGSVGGGGTNAGVVVWLRGGGALYRFHGPEGASGDVNIHLSSVTASNGTVFAPRTSNSSAAGEINPKYPVRASSNLHSQYYYGLDSTQTMYLGESGNDVLIRGQVAIGGTAIQSGYGLTMTGHIDLNNHSVDYVNQLHFQAGVRFYDDNNNNYLNFKWDDTTDGGIRFRNGNGSVMGTVYGDGTDQFGLLDADGSWAVRIDKDVCIDLRVNNSTRILCDTGGTEFRNGGTTVGEVTTGGLARFASDVVAYYGSFSDRRLKTNIKTTTNNLDKILKLEPVEYTWKDGGREGKKEIGLIAQDVEKVVPEVVRENERLNDDTLYKQVDYEHLVSTLIGAIQEQQDQIAELKSEVTNLKSTMCKCKK